MHAIIKRSIRTEILLTILVVTLVLLVILISSNMAKYLALAASGKVQIMTVFTLIGLKLPLHLTMLLPLSMLLGVLLVFGRMSQDQELVVLLSSGLGYKDFYKFIVHLAIALALALAVVTLYVFPVSKLKSLTLDRSIGTGVALENLTAGKFHELSGGNRVIYVESIDKVTKEMQNVFLQIKDKTRQHILRAKYGIIEIDKSGNTILLLKNGTRYTHEGNRLDYVIVEYEKHALLLEKKGARKHKLGVSAQSTKQLLGKLNDKKVQAELQWRLSIPIMSVLMMLLGVALSKYSPRSGKYSKVLPGILIYFAYINIIILVKNKMEAGEWNAVIGMWPVHILFALLIAWLMWQTLKPLKP